MDFVTKAFFLFAYAASIFLLLAFLKGASNGNGKE